MTLPRLASTGRDFDRRLLRAARTDCPPAGAEERALAALGLSSGVEPALARPSPAGGFFSALNWSATLKSLAVGSAVVLCGGATAPGLSTALWLPDSPQAHAQVLGTPSGSQLLPLPLPPGGIKATFVPSRLPAAEPALAAHAVRANAMVSSGAAATQPSSGSGTRPLLKLASHRLSSEIALVQQATRALARGEPAVALTCIDSYRRQYPRGVLATEAGMIQVLALAKTGDGVAAKSLATTLLDADPHGVLASRLRAVIDAGGAADPPSALGGGR